VPLAALADPEAVPRTAAGALGLREAAGANPVEALAAALQSEPTLLVLDNCEHLVAPCADLIGLLLAACPSLAVVTTSRVALHVPAEHVYAIPSLGSHPWRQASGRSREGSEASDLFLDRAATVAPVYGSGAVNL
jgi:predicted ATPase